MMSDASSEKTQIEVCNLATEICTSTSDVITNSLRKKLDELIKPIINSADESKIVHIIASLYLDYGDEEAASLVMERALYLAAHSKVYLHAD